MESIGFIYYFLVMAFRVQHIKAYSNFLTILFFSSTEILKFCFSPFDLSLSDLFHKELGKWAYFIYFTVHEIQ